MPRRLIRTRDAALGLHRVAEPSGVLPQAAWRLDAQQAIWPDEVRVRLERLNLDAASYRQLREAHRRQRRRDALGGAWHRRRPRQDEGLSRALWESGASVMIVRPGSVATA